MQHRLLLVSIVSLVAGCGAESTASGRTSGGGADDVRLGGDTEGFGDASVTDAALQDTGLADTAGEETTPADTELADTAVEDTTPADTGSPDTTPADTGTADTTPADTGVADTGSEAPGPLPDMGSAPLGFLGSVPIGSSGGACGTGSWWWGFNVGSDNMRPGGNCIACHAGNGGPDYTFAGTVMAGYNDADDCRGVPNVQVEILDANGNLALTMTANAAGNFSSTNGGVELPYSARVRIGDRVREMTTQTYNGDCNSCHTTAGADLAPGRVVLP